MSELFGRLSLLFNMFVYIDSSVSTYTSMINRLKSDLFYARSMFDQHLALIVGVLWELIVSPNADVKVSAAVLSKLLVVNAHISTLILSMHLEQCQK